MSRTRRRRVSDVRDSHETTIVSSTTSHGLAGPRHPRALFLAPVTAASRLRPKARSANQRQLDVPDATSSANLPACSPAPAIADRLVDSQYPLGRRCVRLPAAQPQRASVVCRPAISSLSRDVAHHRSRCGLPRSWVLIHRAARLAEPHQHQTSHGPGPLPAQVPGHAASPSRPA